jgi:dihydropteroate synthase
VTPFGDAHPAVVMGVLNVTPDSFSDGGRYSDLDAAVNHAFALHQDGAHLIDVGGESTRPGSARVEPEVEAARVVPVIRALAALGVPMSIDTTRAAVARAALEAGASVVNDVSGGLADPDMAAVVAEAGVPWVLMHWRGHAREMQDLARYADVVKEVRDELRQRADAAVAAGVDPSRIILDPGLGFAKRAEHNWRLSAHLDEIIAIGFPVLVGASRKSYLGQLLAAPDGTPRPTDEREAATVATSVLAVLAGAWGVRVHNVRDTVDALRVLEATRAHR